MAPRAPIVLESDGGFFIESVKVVGIGDKMFSLTLIIALLGVAVLISAAVAALYFYLRDKE